MRKTACLTALLAAGLLPVLLFPAGGEGAPAPASRRGEAWAMFWNVENLFDAVDDPAVEGRDALDPADLAEKIRRIRAVVGRVAWGRGPDLLGLAEVENEELVRRIAGEGYRVIFSRGRYRRGLNVALATRLPLVGKPEFLDPKTTGRTILHAAVRLAGRPLHVFVLHLKSRRNDATATRETRSDEEMREKEAALLRRRLDALEKEAGRPDVLLMGDFNEDYRDSLFRRVLLAREYRRGGRSPRADDDDHRLLNLGPALQQSFPGGGTAYYHPHWNVFDNLLVSESLALPGGLYATPKDAYIAVSWDLLNSYGSPLRFHRELPCGVSDHLPILLRIRK